MKINNNILGGYSVKKSFSIFLIATMIIGSNATFAEEKNVINEEVSEVNQTDAEVSEVEKTKTEDSVQGVVTKTDQDVTAYTGRPGAKGARGTVLTRYYSVAVHPNTCSSNSTVAYYSGPILPFGTTIITDQEISMPGHPNGWDDTFVVEDMGDTACKKGWSRYFFDIYFGEDDGVASTLNQNEKNAIKFGVLEGVSYTAYTP